MADMPSREDFIAAWVLASPGRDPKTGGEVYDILNGKLDAAFDEAVSDLLTSLGAAEEVSRG